MSLNVLMRLTFSLMICDVYHVGDFLPCLWVIVKAKVVQMRRTTGKFFHFSGTEMGREREVMEERWMEKKRNKWIAEGGVFIPASESRVRMIYELTGCWCLVIIPEDLPIMFNLHSSHASHSTWWIYQYLWATCSSNNVRGSTSKSEQIFSDF